MQTDQSETAYYQQFRQQQNQFCRHKATIYIDAIWNLHGTAIDPVRLYHISSSPEPVFFEQNLSGFYVPDINTYICKPPELPIPMCDVTTIHQLKLYVIKLTDELAEAKCGSDYARISDIQDEMEKIADYLKQCLCPSGKIKLDNKIMRSHAHLIRSSVKQFYSALQPININLMNYLQSHVVIGTLCYWEANPKGTRKTS